MNNVTLNSDGLVQAFNALTSRQQKATLQTSVKKAMTVLYRATQSELKTVTDKLPVDGVKLLPYKRKIGANVNILSNYKLKWFELGTNERYTKKGKRTGKMKATKFFKRAVASTEATVINTLNREVSDSIRKKFNKKYGKL